MPHIIVFIGAAAIGLHGTILAVAIGIATSVVLGTIANALQKKNKGGQSLFGAQSRQITIRQAAAPWRIIVGSVRVGGVYTFLHKTGTNGEYLHLVITLAKGKVSAINTMYFDGDSVPLDGSGNATGTYAGHVHVEKSVGDPATSTQEFTGLQTDAPTKWTANHLQRGHAKVYVRVKWNADLFPNGLPNITFDVDGALIYDSRTATTIFSKNPALHVSNYLTQATYGFGAVYANEINDSLLTAAANICDEDVTLKAGGTEDRYVANGVYDLSERPADVIQALCGCMAGYLVYVSGKYEIYAGAYRSPAVTLTEADARGPIKVRTRLSRQEIFNGVKGTYISSANKWQNADFPPYTGGFLTEDGNERVWKDVHYPFTISQATAQRMGKIDLLRARRQITVEFPAKLSAYSIQPPDVIQLTLAQYSWTAKTFEVVGTVLVPYEDDEGAIALGVDLRLRETDSGVYAWTAASDETTAATPGTTTLPRTDSVSAPTGLALASSATTALLRADGVRISRIKCTWTAPADQFVVSGGRILGEYKKNADSTWLPAFEVQGAMAEAYVTEVNDGVAYDVRILAENANGAKSTYNTVSNHTVTGPSLISPHASYRPTTNPLTATDAGATATISIASFTMRFPGNDVSVNSGSIASLSFATLYYVYYDDSDFNGGAVTYGASTTKETALNGASRFFVGSIVTPLDGAVGTIGNNDGGASSQFGQTMIFGLSDVTEFASGAGTVTDGYKSHDLDVDNYAPCESPGNSGSNVARITLKGQTAPYGPAWSSVKLKIKSSVPTNSVNGIWTVASLGYSLQGGRTGFTYIYQLGTGVTRAITTDEITLPANQVEHDVWVQFQIYTETGQTTGTVLGRLYEAWIEVVY